VPCRCKPPKAPDPASIADNLSRAQFKALRWIMIGAKDWWSENASIVRGLTNRGLVEARDRSKWVPEQRRYELTPLGRAVAAAIREGAL
jgi:hypothetical protein